MRVAVGGIAHETNTYATEILGPTTLDAFTVLRGERIFRQAGMSTYLGGMLGALEATGAVAAPTFYAHAHPSGTIDASAYASLRDELLESLASAGAVDAVALELHGAGVAGGTDDIELDLVEAVRAAVGPDVPVGAVFDLHGNLGARMADHLDAIVVVRGYPHDDMAERGAELVEILAAAHRRGVRPVTHVETVPVLLPTSSTETGTPGAALAARCRTAEQRPGVVHCGAFHGFPYTDVPHVGASITCTADDRVVAAAAASDVARWLWEHREDFRLESLGAEEAVDAALALDHGPVVINETSDNPGGGSPGDGTHLLRALLGARPQSACFGFVCDPDVVAAAQAAGVGATASVRLGGKHGGLHGDPIEATAYVKALTDGRVTMQAMYRGMVMDYGPMARLVIDGVDVLVSSRPSQTFDPEVFLAHGIDVTRYHVVALKGSNHFRAGFRGIASSIVTADPPGLTTLDVTAFEHVRRDRPLWPLDPDATYP